MSSESQPISAARFAEAIQDLPVASLNGKALELRNSISHLRSSNDQLQEFADQGDQDCADAIHENETVISRMEERIGLLRAEVEGRGLKWYEDHANKGNPSLNGVNGGDRASVTPTVNGDGPARSAETNRTGQNSGRLTDADLQRLLAERMGEPDDRDDDEGVHL